MADFAQLNFDDVGWGLPPPSRGQDWSLLRKPQTRLKLDILEKYLSDWAPIMLNFFPEVFFIDCFAGRGSYTTIDGIRNGSPLIGANLAHKYQVARHFGSRKAGVSGKSRLICRFVELNKTNYDALCYRVGPFKETVDLKLYKGKYQQFIEGILSEVSDKPAFTLFDPYGIKDIPFSQIEQALVHSGEVLINFSIMGVNRCGGFLNVVENPNSGPKEVRKARMLVRQLDDLFGSADWRKIVRQSYIEPQDKEEKLIQLYIGQLRRFRKYVVSRRLPTSEEGLTISYLVFATENETGLEKFCDAAFLNLRKGLQERPHQVDIDNFLQYKFRGQTIEWGQIVELLGTRYRTSWIKSSLRRLSNLRLIEQRTGTTRPERRNPVYLFH